MAYKFLDDSISETIEPLTRSKAPIYPWYERIDPMHEVVYRDTVTLGWESVSLPRWRMSVTPQGQLRMVQENRQSPIRESPHLLYSQISILAMSVLVQFHQASTLQIASFLGINRQRLWTHISALYRAGILKRTIPPWYTDVHDELANGSGSIWTIDRKGWPYQNWQADLGPVEWAMIFGNDTVHHDTSSPTTIRHNLVTTEIVLRALEACPAVIGSWGDRMTGAGVLYDKVESRQGEIVRSNVGDAALVLRDGQVIVIETVGANQISGRLSADDKLSAKAAGWVAITSRIDIPVKVLFVNVSASAKPWELEKYVRIGVEATSKKYVVSRTARERGQKNIYMVNGFHWFPMERMIDPMFEELEAYSIYHDRYEKLAPRETPTKMIDHTVNAALALHTPSWLGGKAN